MRPARLEDALRQGAVRDARHRLGPGKRGALAIRVARTLAPGVERVEPLLALAERTQILPVHIDAVPTAVDLRRAQLDEIDQRRIEAAPQQIALEAGHGPIPAPLFHQIVESAVHDVLLCPSSRRRSWSSMTRSSGRSMPWMVLKTRRRRRRVAPPPRGGGG